MINTSWLLPYTHVHPHTQVHTHIHTQMKTALAEGKPWTLLGKCDYPELRTHYCIDHSFCMPVCTFTSPCWLWVFTLSWTPPTRWQWLRPGLSHLWYQRYPFSFHSLLPCQVLGLSRATACIECAFAWNSSFFSQEISCCCMLCRCGDKHHHLPHLKLAFFLNWNFSQSSYTVCLEVESLSLKKKGKQWIGVVLVPLKPL